MNKLNKSNTNSLMLGHVVCTPHIVPSKLKQEKLVGKSKSCLKKLSEFFMILQLEENMFQGI